MMIGYNRVINTLSIFRTIGCNRLATGNGNALAKAWLGNSIFKTKKSPPKKLTLYKSKYKKLAFTTAISD